MLLVSFCLSKVKFLQYVCMGRGFFLYGAYLYRAPLAFKTTIRSLGNVEYSVGCRRPLYRGCHCDDTGIIPKDNVYTLMCKERNALVRNTLNTSIFRIYVVEDCEIVFLLHHLKSPVSSFSFLLHRESPSIIGVSHVRYHNTGVW